MAPPPPPPQPAAEISQFQHIPLGPILQEQEAFQDLRIFRHRRISSQGKDSIVQDTFYSQDPFTETYSPILAWPVYENGVIFGNYLLEEGGTQKGAVIRSFFQTMFPNFQTMFPHLMTMVPNGRDSIVAMLIDDNPAMLENAQAVCEEMGILFFGIHCKLPTVWVSGSRAATKK
jgi:hypothetical protein